MDMKYPWRTRLNILEVSKVNAMEHSITNIDNNRSLVHSVKTGKDTDVLIGP